MGESEAKDEVQNEKREKVSKCVVWVEEESMGELRLIGKIWKAKSNFEVRKKIMFMYVRVVGCIKKDPSWEDGEGKQQSQAIWNFQINGEMSFLFFNAS